MPSRDFTSEDLFSSPMMSMHSSTHSSQMNTVEPAMSLRTSCWLLPQNVQCSVFLESLPPALFISVPRLDASRRSRYSAKAVGEKMQHWGQQIARSTDRPAVSCPRHPQPRCEAFVSVEAAKNFGRAICQGDFVVARRGEQPGDRNAYFSGTNHDDVLHARPGSSSENNSKSRLPVNKNLSQHHLIL